MTTSSTEQRRSVVDMSPAFAPSFSYAQAAKGISSNASSVQASRLPSGTITPAKEESNQSSLPAIQNEKQFHPNDINTTLKEKVAINTERFADQTPTSPLDGSTAAPSNGIASPSSPAFGASSTSTLVREDDASSVPNAYSDSVAWENKSQSSTQEKPAETAEVAGEKESAKGEKQEAQPAPKPVLHEAPLPSVNIWQQRAKEQKSRVVPTTHNPSSMQAENASRIQHAPSAGRAQESKSSARGGPEEKGYRKNRERSAEEQPKRARRSSLPGSREQGDRQSNVIPNTAPLPSMGDSESWPTPLFAQDGDRRRASEKADSGRDKERTAAPTAANKGKTGWVSVPINPTVVFNTPINTGARRGGTRGGRGGREGGRGGARESTRVNGSGERIENGTSSYTNGEPAGRRPRPEESSRSVSPIKGRRGGGEERSRQHFRPTPLDKDQPSKDSDVAVPVSEAKTKAPYDDSTSRNTTPPNGISRNLPRPKQPRRQDGLPNGEDRRRESQVDPVATANNHVSHERRQSMQQTDEQVEKAVPGGDAASPRYQPPDRRHSQYNTYPNRERGDRGGRGGIRRTGGHGFNGAPNQQLNGTFPPVHGYPSSRGGYRGGSRAHSIPTESVYGRFGNNYPPNQYLPPLQTGMPNGGMYDLPNPYSMSAVPFHHLGHYDVANMVVTQLDYYFSTENLIKDVYLRKHMDSQGFALLSFVASFNRLKNLTQDFELIKYACTLSPNIEQRIGADGKERIRKREDWEKWVMPVADRDPSAQSEGPGEFRHQGLSQLETGMPMRQTSLPAFNSPMSAPAFQPMNGFHTHAGPVAAGPKEVNGLGLHTSPTSGYGQNFRTSPQQGASTSPQGMNGVSTHNPEADDFSNAQVNGLTVVWRAPEGEGSKQSTKVAGQDAEAGRPEHTETTPLTNGHSGTQENELARLKQTARDSTFSPFSLDTSKLSRQNSNHSNTHTIDNQPGIYWLEHKESPSQELPPNTCSDMYVDLRAHALQLREHAKAGVLPHDMELLYQFWSHFLVRNFNTGMYDEFRTLAFEDAAKGIQIGVVNLLKYYGCALKRMDPIRFRVARHYVQLVKSESDFEGAAFKQLRSAWRDGALNIKNRKRVMEFLDADLRVALDG